MHAGSQTAEIICVFASISVQIIAIHYTVTKAIIHGLTVRSAELSNNKQVIN